MEVLGIVGSPRREKGMTNQVVTRILEGARSAGGATSILYLVDENPGYCVHCGYPCFASVLCVAFRLYMISFPQCSFFTF